MSLTANAPRPRSSPVSRTTTHWARPCSFRRIGGRAEKCSRPARSTSARSSTLHAATRAQVGAANKRSVAQCETPSAAKPAHARTPPAPTPSRRTRERAASRVLSTSSDSACATSGARAHARNLRRQRGGCRPAASGPGAKTSGASIRYSGWRRGRRAATSTVSGTPLVFSKTARGRGSRASPEHSVLGEVQGLSPAPEDFVSWSLRLGDAPLAGNPDPWMRFFS